jgi:hypothetical protein
MAEEIEHWDFVTRLAPEPENDKPGLMRAFDEIVTGPLDSVHIERMSDDLYWIVLCKDGECQRIVIGSASGKAKVVARTEID